MLAISPNAPFKRQLRYASRPSNQFERLARRNVLIALQAGRMLELSEPALAAYGAPLRFADFTDAGNDILASVARDLEAACLLCDEAELRSRLRAADRAGVIEVSSLN